MLKKLRTRPQWLPWAWRRITPADGLTNYVMKRDWQLVLDSQGIDFIVVRFANQTHLYVAPLQEHMANQQISAYYRENSLTPSPAAIYPVYKHSYLIMLFLLPLPLLYIIQHSSWPGFPSSKAWQDAGCLDAIKIVILHQWYRGATALTLHASLPHLVNNLFFSSIFLSLLARVAGIGRAIFLTVTAATLANLISALSHNVYYRSLGFSTALFAAAGILAGMMIWRTEEKRKMFLPVAAALAILALFGTAGENTDYGAHIAGLGTGFGLGVLAGLFIHKNWYLPHGALAVSIALLIPVLAWFWAWNPFY